MSNPLANELNAILTTPAEEARTILTRLGVPASTFVPHGLVCRSPITGRGDRAILPKPQRPDVEAAIARAAKAFLEWREVPAPRRGEFVRLLGEELRAAKADLGRLVTIEAGKIVSEGLGEVQEMIDICDFAVGLSRQLHGLTIVDRAAGPPHDGNLAPDRRLRRHHRLQLPGRGLVVERGARLRLRQSRRVEALREDAAHGARRARRSSSAPRKRFGEVPRGLDARCSSAGARVGRGAGRRRARGARLGDGLDRHGPRRRRRASRGASRARSSSSAATTPRS